MIDPITNFSIHSVELINNQTKITFTFTKPTGNIGGYYLFMSSTGVEYVNVKTRIDATHPQEDADNTYDSEGITYFEYTIADSADDGKLLYFKIQALSTSREVSTFSDIETTYSYPSIPQNVSLVYDGIQVELDWDDIDFTGTTNSTFTNYNIYRDIAVTVSGTSYDEENEKLENDQFTVGTYIWVFDVFKRVQWFGAVTTAGEFDLSTTKLDHYSDQSASYTVNLDNLNVYIQYGSPSLIGVSTSSGYVDTNIEFDKYYIYSVKSVALGIRMSNAIYHQSYTVDTTNAYPYLRPVENSDTDILQNKYWRRLKSVLTDSNYYDKSAYAIPYSKNTEYNLKGYLGVANCKFDVYVNGIYGFTTSTGIYGEFDVNYTFNKGTTELVFQARDRLNIKFSRKSAPYSIRTFNIYTFFSVLGLQYEAMDEELSALQTDINIEDCRYSNFEDRFSPFIDLYKHADESETKFRNIASVVFKAFEYVAYDKALDMVLDVFRDNIDEFDHYEIYYNESLYDTQRTAYTFTPTSTGLNRGDYYYGVSSRTIAGEETPPSIMRVDRRWWADPYTSTNVIVWDYVPDADCYLVYRGSSSTGLEFLTSTGNNFFVDINRHAPVSSIIPLEYNFTDLEKPQNLTLYDKFGVNNLFLRLKKPSSLIILIFGRDNDELEDYDVQRILSLFEKFIPPELRWTLLFSNDSKVIVYPEGTEIDLVEPDLVYARYDESYYYHTSVDEEVYS